MKPMNGLTKSERKKYRSKMHAQYSNVDLSFNTRLNTQNVCIINNYNYII